MITFTNHAYAKLGRDFPDVAERGVVAATIMAVASFPSVAYGSTRREGVNAVGRGWRVVLTPARDKIITFTRNVVETPNRPDQGVTERATYGGIDLVNRAKIDRAKRDAKRNARREADRAFTTALKAGKGKK